GITKDPSKQEAYNQVLKNQWTECLTKYGKINELWFDGSCKVDVTDVIKKYAPNTVIFQGPMASIRWPGSERGTIQYPAWNSLKKNDLATGLATVAESDPDGRAWAPLESNTTLYDHNWFWSPANEKKRKSLKHLVKVYYHSVGRGTLMLLNSTPMSNGLIPEADMQRYKELGDEITRRFSNPIVQTKGIGTKHLLTFSKPTLVNQFMLMEDYRYGERIREFKVEAKDAHGIWSVINTGSAVGRKRIVVFKERPVTALRLTITKHVGTPLLRAFKAFYVNDIGYDYLIEQPKAISIGKPATASNTHSAPYAASKINDGNAKTRWSSSDNATTCWVELDLKKHAYVNQVTLKELKTRVQQFQIEYRGTKNEAWKVAYSGTKIGEGLNIKFPTVYGRFFRLNILKSTQAPTLWQFQLNEDQNPNFVFYTLKSSDFKSGEAKLKLDISQYFTKPGKYKIVIQSGNKSKLEVLHFEPLYNENTVLKEMYKTVQKNQVFTINRTAQIVEESKVEVKFHLKGKQAGDKFIIYPPSY
ncbi:MAG: alpha-L-fucosidase, partial [Lentisphaeria bacterium]|nr:alpha-L-fucosidase [Lentisphaeria bacterium]